MYNVATTKFRGDVSGCEEVATPGTIPENFTLENFA
jgi:hypothetical protein